MTPFSSRLDRVLERLAPLGRAVDRTSDGVGRLAGWLTLLMVVVGAGNAIFRYLGRFVGWNLSSNAWLELQWYLFSLVFLLGGAYALRRRSHVRVDVLYGRLGTRAQAMIDVVGHVLFLLPFSLFVLWVSWPSVRSSWVVRELSPDAGGLPRYPLKTVILVAFVLLFVQGLAELRRDLRAVVRGEREDDEAPPTPEAHA